MSTKKPSSAQLSAGPKPKKECRLKDECNRTNCYFQHPGGKLCPQYPKACENSTGCTGRHPLKLCYYRDACTDASCTQTHSSGGLCPFFPDACENTSPCESRHPPAIPMDERKDCKYGTSCTIKQCLFKHAGGPSIMTSKQNKTEARNASPPKKTMSEKKSSHTKPKKPAVSKVRLDELIQKAIEFHAKSTQVEKRRLQKLEEEIQQQVDIDSVEAETRKALRARVDEMNRQLAVFRCVVDRISSRHDLPDNQKEYLTKREIFRLRNPLPALGKRLEIEACLEKSKFTIVQGQTGSGKSTQIPQYAADMECFAGKRILCTQPRKLAATSLATRVAFEFSAGFKDAKVGLDVGFRVGGSGKYSRRTRIEFVTEAILLDMIIKARVAGTSSENPFANVGCVVIDEAHERSINCDLIMGSFKEAHPNWQDVKVVVTSATIDLAMFSSFYGNAPVVEIEGRMFPVDLNYIPAGRDGMLDATHVVAAVAEAAVTIHQHFPDPSDGDVLCFLPGQDDVLRAKQHFEKIIAKNAKQAGTSDSVVAHALYGKQDPDEQAEVLKKYTGAASQRKRKVIFSTNIAETSVTIDGVVFVVDSGLMKGVVYDPIRNMTSLKVHAISRSSAIQRMGRAGRTQPGKCFRLYSIKDFNEMEVGSVAEIFQQPLSLALLTLYHIGIDPRHFAWLQSPNDAAMAQAEEELTFLGAIDASKQLTDLGKLIADVQLDPRIVRMIDCGSRRGLGCVATDLAAVMSVAHIFFWRGGNDKKAKAEAAKKKAQFLTSDGDIVSMYHAYCEWKTVLNTGTINESNDGSGNETGTVEEEDDEDPEEATTAAMGAALKRTVALVRRNSDLWKQGQEEEEENKDNNDTDTAIDDDDDDTSSVCSEEPSPVKQRAPKVKNVFDLRRIATKWCVKNSLNGKALGIALAFAKELRGIFRKTAGWKIGGNDAKVDDAVDGESIRRLITTGYFMNVARLKPISRFGLQYYALYSGVTGSLHFGSALNPDRNVDKSNAPQWILFDSILRLTTTTFLSLGTPVEKEWITAESEAFSALCTKKSQDLPVEILEWKDVSYEVMRGLFGKNFCLVNRLEARLKCNILLDPAAGKVSVCCTLPVKGNVQSELDKMITEERGKMDEDILEVVYMGNTRVALSKGFVVTELLFGTEFSTLFVKNMSQRTEAELYQRMENMRNKPNRTPTVRSLDMTNHADGKMSATIRFMSKQIAKEVYDNLRGEVSRDGETLEVTPGFSASVSQRKSLKQDFAGRIKLSWADGISNQKAKIFFPSAADANNFILNCCNIQSLESLSLAAVGRNPNRTDQDSTGMIGIGQQAQPGTEALPPLKRVPHPTQNDKYAFIFDEEVVTAMTTTEQVKLHFGVSIKSGLPESMDEVELLSLVRPIPVLYAKIFRRDDKSQSSTVNQQGVIEGRFMRMLPLLSFLDNSAVQSDFFDTQTRRAGTTVVFDDIRQLETTFLNASESDLWDKEDKPYGQPVRMELDYTYTTSIHSELYECFKVQVAEVITWARSKCIVCQEIPPKCGSAASKAMMSFKFCCPSLALLNRVREKLELCLQCDKVKGEHVLKLFSFTGRALAQQIQDTSLSTEMQQVYIRWIQKKREFWVYGAPEQRRQAVEQLIKLSEKLGALEVLDKLVPLDRKSVAALGFNQTNSRNKKPDLRAARNEIARIIRDCSEKLCYYNINDSGRMLMSGTNAAIKAAIKVLGQHDLLFKAHHRKTGDKPDCSLCMDVVEDPYLTMSFCNHACCVGCFEPQLNYGTLPLSCSTCGKLIHTNNIIGATNGDTISSLVERAVFEYIPTHQDTCMICPKPGCNQILPTYTGILEGKEGGRFIFCDNCLRYYCIDCSEKTGRCVDRHDDESCEEVQLGGLSKLAQHVQHIQERILNLCCPKCKATFLDFSGCTCVKCGNPTCDQHFCANCLQYSSSSSNATHSHVRSCSKNPGNDYFVSEQALNEVHRVMRTQNLITYFTNEIQSEKIRFHVHTRIAKDLLDLRIELPKSLWGNSSGDDPLRKYLTHVREELLNIKCPACHLVFVDFDFDSCAALTCANPTCNRGFCAYCLVDCKEDAHAHVSKCELNPHQPYFYVTEEDFTDIHKRRRENAIAEYLRGLPQQDARGVWKELQENLRHLGLEVKSP